MREQKHHHYHQTTTTTTTHSTRTNPERTTCIDFAMFLLLQFLPRGLTQTCGSSKRAPSLSASREGTSPPPPQLPMQSSRPHFNFSAFSGGTWHLCKVLDVSLCFNDKAQGTRCWCVLHFRGANSEARTRFHQHSEREQLVCANRLHLYHTPPDSGERQCR